MLATELECRFSGQDELALTDAPQDDAIMRVADKVMEEFGPRTKLKVDNVRREDEADYAQVDLNSATTSLSRSVGPELLVHDAWLLLKLPQVLEELGLNASERSLAEAVVAARLIQPGSDLATWRWIRNCSAIGELTEENLSNVGRNRVYDIADRLCGFRQQIETHLRGRVSNLFPSQNKLFLFDLTNFYLEGQALGNTLAHHGKSKENRRDCRLVSLALAVNEQGFPLFSRIYPGNIGEPATLHDILADAGLLTAQPNLPHLGEPTVVMDRGIATKDNIKLLADNHISYIAIERGARNKDHLNEFKTARTDPAFTRIDRGSRGGILVKKVLGQDANTVEVLCLSDGKQKKERAMSRRWIERASEDLLNFQKSIRKRNIVQRDKILRKLGRFEERYSNFSKYFKITLIPEESAPNRIADLTFKRKPVFDLPAAADDPLWGTYVIQTPKTDLSATEIWELYMTLTQVESAFRSLKTDLGTRPIYHQLAERTEAHLFISILAYHLLSWIRYTLEIQGDLREWKTIHRLLSIHSLVTTQIQLSDGSCCRVAVSSVLKRSTPTGFEPVLLG